jgi:Mlc titration factor MtfA (ptsG expression regulator)
MLEAVKTFFAGAGAVTLVIVALAALTFVVYGAMRLVAHLLRYLPLGARVRFRSDPIPTEWESIVARNVTLAARLPLADRERLLRLVQVFLDEEPMEGCNGIVLTEEMRVTIAAQACLLLLKLRYPRYPRLKHILVYPGTFVPHRVEAPGPTGAVYQPPVPELGEAWASGTVVLSWPSSLSGGRDRSDGHNVVLHEFAHVLDHEDGVADGVPLLEPPSSYRVWGYVMGSYFRRYQQLTEQAAETTLDPYGATNRAEFFAVATESFFEQPRQLLRNAPEVYEELRKFYHQDPAALPEGSTAT